MERDVQLVHRLNVLWREIYPHLAEWILQWWPHRSGRVVELGPFSGGICEALLIRSRDARGICVMPQKEVAREIRRHFPSRIEVGIGALSSLPFDAAFDLVVFRGAFFFLTSEMIQEAYRVLKPGGCALLGGGYGPGTPEKEIEKIAAESKRLNYQLGKRWLSGKELAQMVKDAAMENNGRILHEGGLWLLLQKHGS